VIKSKKSLEEVYDFYILFIHKSELELSSSALAEQNCCAGDRRVVQLISNNMHFIRDMRMQKAKLAFKKYSEKISLDMGSYKHKLRNAINIHGMSLNISSPDIQIVNMWICLETLIPSSKTGTKIGNVVRNVIPILMLGYFSRLTLNLVFDVLRWNRRVFTNSISMMANSGDGDLRAKFINLLTNEENAVAKEHLFEKCGDFELLRNRMWFMSDMLSDSKKALERISTHQKVVEWQIHRIYRTRNSIVHSGGSPDYTNYLVENAHGFFDQTMLFCLELSAWKNGFDDFVSCFDYASKQYNDYLTNLRSSDNAKIVWELPKYRDNSVVFGDDQ
jgi:hypothetical protein